MNHIARHVSIVSIGLVAFAQCGCSGGSGQGSNEGFVESVIGGTLSAVGVDSRATQAVKSGVAIGTKAWELDQLTPENEYYIGRAVAANLVARYGVYEDADAARYVSLVGYTCAASSEMPETFAGYRFIILDTDEINAFGAPGGYVLVTRGMLRACESEHALAAVLSHEIAHVQHRDGLNAIKNSEMWKTGLSEGAKLAADGDIPAATALFDDLIDGFVDQVIDKGYSRSAERQADAAGVEIMIAAGYDPHGMLDMLEEMNAAWDHHSGMGKTHPSPDERIRRVEPMVTTTRAAASRAQQQRFDAAMASIRSE